jgi:CRISPR-associated protein Cst1
MNSNINLQGCNVLEGLKPKFRYMNQEIKNINYEWLTRPTGDPFADVGGYVIEYLSEKDASKNILEWIEEIAKLYHNNFLKSIYSNFPNTPLTQSYSTLPNENAKIEKRIGETVKKFHDIILNKTTKPGFCRITGAETMTIELSKDYFILAGSGAFVNFHHAFSSGLMVSKEIAIRLFFAPLGVIKLSDKFALLQSSAPEMTRFFAQNNCKTNYELIIKGINTSHFFDFPIRHISSALFSFIDDAIAIVRIQLEQKKEITLTLFHYSNFNQGASLEHFHIPANVFAFYAFCTQGKYLKDWNYFIRSQYYNAKQKGAVYNSKTECFDIEKKGTKNSTDFNSYKTWINFVYNKLLNGQSILKDFLRWSKKHQIDFKIIEVYQEKIGFMKKETIEKIKEMANFITQNENEDVIKKSIGALNGAKNPYLLRRFIIKNIVAENYKQGNEKALVSLDDYANYLFPDGNSWQEIRDMLIIAIYQNMHKLNLNIEIELEEEENYTEQ